MSVTLIAMIALLAGCVNTVPAELPLRITNFQQGLVRQRVDGAWEIYETGNRYRFVPNGQCATANGPQPCLLHAVSFDYIAGADTTKLDCNAEFSKPVDVLDPKTLKTEQVRSHKFTAELQGRSGNAFWQGSAIRDDKPLPDEVTVRCFSRGVDILHYTYTIIDVPVPSSPSPPSPPTPAKSSSDPTAPKKK